MPESEPLSNQQTPAPKSTSVQLAVVAALIVGYAVVSQYASTTPDAKGFATGLSVGPLLILGAIFVWHRAHAAVALSAFALVGVLLVRFWTTLTQYYEWNDVVQQCGVYGLASLGFGRSLLGGREPLCTQLSRNLHGQLTAAEISYTRKATLAWSLFYGLLAVVILVLFFIAPLRVWALFTNFACFGLIGSMFAVDHAIRRHILPRRPGGIMASIRQSLTGSR